VRDAVQPGPALVVGVHLVPPPRMQSICADVAEATLVAIQLVASAATISATTSSTPVYSAAVCPRSQRADADMPRS